MIDWLMDRPHRIFGLMVIIFITVFGLLIWSSINEQKAWDDFASKHDCKLIAHASGYTTYGYFNGKYQSYWVASRDTFHCNDGVDYTR